ncbi:helix-turn-helix domain-containing protein [[Clostridium] polysaccharolyticum]|uniref:DNA-binding transcriptional regulator, XRE-family HTH domain n=1 Tax=[Clostridium] polysaccharolyticum TaxID=29364 RepID=A0A1I0BMX6_9FIRM|nr:helix-turn-helix transcriptional regulator [[Clostridium] polysaccharolyticum]SET08326.1 DNA-binding transcriptional regulator, XRE-family HTH domain [[Clostridium] polysaccharolyticum]
MYERFELLLEEFHVTAYKVAKETNVARSTLTNWKQGNYTPKMEKIQRIASYFKVSAEWLLGYDVPRTPHNSTAELNGRNSSLNLSADTMQNLPDIIQYAIDLLKDNETILVNGKALSTESKEKLQSCLESCSKEISKLYKDLL